MPLPTPSPLLMGEKYKHLLLAVVETGGELDPSLEKAITHNYEVCVYMICFNFEFALLAKSYLQHSPHPTAAHTHLQSMPFPPQICDQSLCSKKMYRVHQGPLKTGLRSNVLNLKL